MRYIEQGTALTSSFLITRGVDFPCKYWQRVPRVSMVKESLCTLRENNCLTSSLFEWELFFPCHRLYPNSNKIKELCGYPGDSLLAGNLLLLVLEL
jgi:hypothetical protein